MRNKAFMIYYVILIVMVIDCHCNTRMGFLTSIFPYDSFCVPAFVFISGYFYKNNGFLNVCKHKFIKLWLPYMLWNGVFILLTLLIDSLFQTSWAWNVSLHGIVGSAFFHPCTDLNGASWFVVMLFEVCVAYEVINLVIKNDICKSIVIFLLAITGLYLSIYHYPEGNGWRLRVTLYRMMFYLCFYNMGYMFRLHIEKRLKMFSDIKVGVLCLFLGALIYCLFGENVRFMKTSHMHQFHYILLPFVSSSIGIVFYYELCQWLQSIVNKNKYMDSFVEIISRNTFMILEVHLLFINTPLLFIRKMNIIQWYDKFSYESHNLSPWISGDKELSYIQFWVSILLCLALVYAKEFICRKLRKSSDTIPCSKSAE